MSITPQARPQMSRPEVLTYLTAANIDITKSLVVIVGMRGYYANTFGKPGANDIGVDDDAFFVVSPRAFRSFNGNTDPSVKRSKIATLLTGLYQAIKWLHKGKYRGYQITQDRVSREGLTGVDTGRHGINFHYHGSQKTDSEGCQTLPKSQYPEFVKLVDTEMDYYRVNEFIYLLVDKTKGA